MNTKEKKLKNESANPFMEEVDPRNPYGPNYEELPYDTKVYYKFNRVKKFVHLEKDDQDQMLNFNYKYIFGMLGAAVVGCVGGYAIKRFLIKPFFSNFEDWIDQFSGVYYGLFFAGSATLAYYKLDDMYIKQVCYPLLDKYLDQAIKNGFEDYKISHFKKIESEF